MFGGVLGSSGFVEFESVSLGFKVFISVVIGLEVLDFGVDSGVLSDSLVFLGFDLVNKPCIKLGMPQKLKLDELGGGFFFVSFGEELMDVAISAFFLNFKTHVLDGLRLLVRWYLMIVFGKMLLCGYLEVKDLKLVVKFYRFINIRKIYTTFFSQENQ